MHLVIADSGVGGLTVCAGIEKALRESGRGARLTYVNAWPEQGRGYNDLPDMAARARRFDTALRRMADMAPDRIVIACNTLSIVYEHTAFGASASVPVQGIVDAGVDLFERALALRPLSSIVLLGTRTTIQSGVHRERLLRASVAPDRVAAASCHGLAAAIERDPDGADTAALIATCAAGASEAARPGEPLLAGLCCTHYGLIADRLGPAIAERSGRETVTLDPNAELASGVAAGVPAAATPGDTISVEMVSKVSLGDDQRRKVAALIAHVSPATADALRQYRHDPGLF
jgi:glutamate racemase